MAIKKQNSQPEEDEPDGDWDNALQEISGNTKSDKTSVNFLEKLPSIYQRLEMLTSGHEGACTI